MAELQRQVHQEDGAFLQLQLDDQPLDAGLEVVEALALDARRGQERIGLLAHDGHQLIDRGRAVLALVGGVVAERIGDLLGLVDQPGADRAGVDLDQADQVGIERFQPLGDAVQDLGVAAEVARAGHRQVEGRAETGGVPDVVQDEAHRVGGTQNVAARHSKHCRAGPGR